MVVQGLSCPEDKGNWLQMISGHPLRQVNYEMIGDQSLGLPQPANRLLAPIKNFAILSFVNFVAAELFFVLCIAVPFFRCNRANARSGSKSQGVYR
jgi:hypothetical protein